MGEDFGRLILSCKCIGRTKIQLRELKVLPDAETRKNRGWREKSEIGTRKVKVYDFTSSRNRKQLPKGGRELTERKRTCQERDETFTGQIKRRERARYRGKGEKLT